MYKSSEERADRFTLCWSFFAVRLGGKGTNLESDRPGSAPQPHFPNWVSLSLVIVGQKLHIIFIIYSPKKLQLSYGDQYGTGRRGW